MSKTKIANGAPYKIEKGIKKVEKYKDRRRFPFANMEINDSFLIPKLDQPVAKARISIYSAVNSYNKSASKKIKCSTGEVEDGLRVWRIK